MKLIFTVMVLLLLTISVVAETESTNSASNYEMRVVELANELRQHFGLHCWAYNETLAYSSAKHVKDLHDRGYFSHTSLEGLSPEDRARRDGYAGFATESLAAGSIRDTPESVMTAWRGSRLHYRGFFFTSTREAGVGFYSGPNHFRNYWGLVQGRRDSGIPDPQPCTATSIQPITHLPTDVTVTETAFTTPTFTWTHNTATTADRVPATEYTIEIVVGTEVFSGQVLLHAGEYNYNASDICSGTFCSITSPQELQLGTYMLYVRANSAAGNYIWNSTQEGAIFTVTDDEPVQPLIPVERVVPTDGMAMTTVEQYTPRFQWQHNGSEGYGIWVGSQDYTKQALYQWFPAFDDISGSGPGQGVCDSVTDICTLPNDLWLTNGNYSWWMSYWAPQPGMNNTVRNWAETFFTVNFQTPNPITSRAPAGTVASATTLSWDHDPNAMWYQIWLGTADYNHTDLYKWFDARDICTGTTCTITLADEDATLASGDYEWWMEVWGPAAYQGWMANGPTNFILSP